MHKQRAVVLETRNTVGSRCCGQGCANIVWAIFRNPALLWPVVIASVLAGFVLCILVILQVLPASLCWTSVLVTVPFFCFYPLLLNVELASILARTFEVYYLLANTLAVVVGFCIALRDERLVALILCAPSMLFVPCVDAMVSSTCVHR